MTVPLATVAQRTKALLEQDIGRALSAAESCANSGRMDQVLWVLSLAARDVLRAGMFAIRWERDLPRGRDYFRRAAEINPRFLDFVSQGLPAAAWCAHHLIYCNLLSDRFDDAVRLAEWAHGFDTPDPRLGDAEHEAFGRLLGLFVLDRRQAFSALRTQYFCPPKRKLYPFWRWLQIYLDLYQAVLDRDQARFEELMPEREAKYLARSKDEKAGESRPEFGGGMESNFTFDFMGVGIAKIAVQRGMRCDFDATHLPKVVVHSV